MDHLLTFGKICGPFNAQQFQATKFNKICPRISALLVSHRREDHVAWVPATGVKAKRRLGVLSTHVCACGPVVQLPEPVVRLVSVEDQEEDQHGSGDGCKARKIDK
jgi:hypothetical protein